MNWKTVLLLVVGLLIFAAPLSAQQDTTVTMTRGGTSGPPTHRFEIIPMGGYVWTVSQGGTYTGFGGDFDLDNSEYFGVAVDFNVHPFMDLRLLYRPSTWFKDQSRGWMWTGGRTPTPKVQARPCASRWPARRRGRCAAASPLKSEAP